MYFGVCMFSKGKGNVHFLNWHANDRDKIVVFSKQCIP